MWYFQGYAVLIIKLAYKKGENIIISTSDYID